MALCLASSLVACHDFVPYDQLVRYKWWYQYGYMSSIGECFSIGSATRDALDEFIRRQHIFAKKHKIHLDDIDYLSDPQFLRRFNVYCSTTGAAGNGALMRLAPVPLFFHEYLREAIVFSGYSAQITHGDRKAYDACRYFGALIFAATHNFTKDDLLDKDFYEKHRSWFGNTPLCDEIKTIAEGSYKKKGGYNDGIRGKGYIVDALEAALWAFWSDENDFEKGVLAAVNLGDDTDTTAAIYGQLAGAHYGYKNLPKKWVNQICAGKFILTLSKWIAYEGKNRKRNKITSASDQSIADITHSASIENISSNKTEPTSVEHPSQKHFDTAPIRGKSIRNTILLPDIDSTVISVENTNTDLDRKYDIMDRNSIDWVPNGHGLEVSSPASKSKNCKSEGTPEERPLIQKDHIC